MHQFSPALTVRAMTKLLRLTLLIAVLTAGLATIAPLTANALGSRGAFCGAVRHLNTPSRLSAHPILIQMTNEESGLQVYRKYTYALYGAAITQELRIDIYGVSNTTYAEAADLAVAIRLDKRLATSPTAALRASLSKALANVSTHAISLAAQVARVNVLWPRACAVSVTTTTALSSADAAALSVANDATDIAAASDTLVTPADVNTAVSETTGVSVVSLTGSPYVTRAEFAVDLSGPTTDVCVAFGTSIAASPRIIAC